MSAKPNEQPWVALVDRYPTEQDARDAFFGTNPPPYRGVFAHPQYGDVHVFAHPTAEQLTADGYGPPRAETTTPAGPRSVATEDGAMWLSGDEDGGVSLNCRECDRGGLPVAFYISGLEGDDPYAKDPRVESVATILDLYVAAIHHSAVIHP